MREGGEGAKGRLALATESRQAPLLCVRKRLVVVARLRAVSVRVAGVMCLLQRKTIRALTGHRSRDG